MGNLEAELTDDMIKLFRRPSIGEHCLGYIFKTYFFTAPDDIRRSTKADIEQELSNLTQTKSDENNRNRVFIF